MNNEQFDRLLESVLKRKSKAPADEASINRVLQRISGPLPPQKQPLWRLPAVLWTEPEEYHPARFQVDRDHGALTGHRLGAETTSADAYEALISRARPGGSADLGQDCPS